MKKGLLILIMLVFTASLVVAAGSQETTAQAEPTVVPITYMYPDSDTAKFPKNTDRPNIAYLVGYARDNFGIDWKLEPVLGSRMETVFNTRLAANNLPDMVDYRLDQNRLIDIYQQGHIIALNDLVDKYGPRIKELMYEFDPYLWVANGDAEGNLLRFVRQVANKQHRVRVLCLNIDWLEDFGLPMPETTDELYNALKTFRDNDANGNGLKDEIASGFLVNYNRSLANAFGVPDMTDAKTSFYYDDNGKIYHTMLSPEAKNYYAFMAKMANEGILDKEIINQSGEMWNAKQYAYRVSLTAEPFWGPVLLDSQIRSKGYPDAEYLQMLPISSPGVEPTIAIRELPGYNGYMITSKSKYPDRITQLMNWAMTIEGSQQEYYGATDANLGDSHFIRREYKGYPLAEYGLSQTPKMDEEMKAEPLLWQKRGINTGLLPHMLYGNNADIGEALENAFGSISGRGSDFETALTTLTAYEEVYGVPGFAMVAPNSEQSAVFEDNTDLFLYIDEMTQKFIIGTESLDRWDEFLANCKRLGIDEIIKVVQERYDAYVKIVGK